MQTQSSTPQEDEIEARQILQPELMAGEILLWCGRPMRSAIFHSSDAWAIPFSLMWGGFSIFWEASVLGIGREANSHAAPSFFILWGIPFVVIGQYMIWGRFFYDAWKKTKIAYGVTNRRVLVQVQGKTRKVIDAQLQTLPNLQLIERGNGTGSIRFLPDAGLGWINGGSNRNFANIGPQLESLAFFDIADVRRVYQIIRDARSA